MHASLRFRRVVPALALASLAWLIAFAPGARAESIRASIEIAFVGHATLHDFEGRADPVAISIEPQPDGTWSGEVLVPVAELDTDNAQRDEKLREMFDAARHPQIRGLFRDVDAERIRRDGVLPLLLRIRDVERPVQAKLSNWLQDDRRASFDAAFDVSLAEFGLAAPNLLVVRVDDEVRVAVHVTLERN